LKVSDANECTGANVDGDMQGHWKDEKRRCVVSALLLFNGGRDDKRLGCKGRNKSGVEDAEEGIEEDGVVTKDGEVIVDDATLA
jgi:hypothetical protein